jgi:hypothetical protein
VAVFHVLAKHYGRGKMKVEVEVEVKVRDEVR